MCLCVFAVCHFPFWDTTSRAKQKFAVWIICHVFMTIFSNLIRQHQPPALFEPAVFVLAKKPPTKPANKRTSKQERKKERKQEGKWRQVVVERKVLLLLLVVVALVMWEWLDENEKEARQN